MKAIILTTCAALAVTCAASCQRSMPPVPQNNRAVVAPRGSTNIQKPWNSTTQHEGDAVLGPLSNMRR